MLTGGAASAGGLGPAISLDGVFVAIGVLTASVLVFGRIASTTSAARGRPGGCCKAAPITGTELLRGKLPAAAVPFVLLSTPCWRGPPIWLGFSPLGALYGWYGVELIGTGMLALASAGVPWARLDWDDPRQMGSGWGALVTALSSFLFALLAGSPALPAPAGRASLAPDLAPAAWIFCPGVVIALTAGTIALSLQFGTARLATVGEA